MDYGKIYEELKLLLTPIGEKIGQGANFAWDTVVHQMTVIGIGMVMGSFFAYLSAFALTWLALGCGKKSDSLPKATYYTETGKADWRASQVFLHLLAVIPFSAGSYLLINGVMHILSPDFYAIEFFINLVKSNVPQ